MNELPAKPSKETGKTPVPPRRLLPGWLTWGVLLLLLAFVLLIQVGSHWIEAGGIDEAAGNLVTYAAVIVAAITFGTWFSFRSTYPLLLRLGVMALGVVAAIGLVRSIRLDGITGNWIPTGVRMAWQPARDYQLAKPPQTVSLSTTQQQTPPALPLETIAATPNDFPQFLGPTRDGRLPDAQLSHDWESNPPQFLWRQKVGAGWAGFAVVADRAVTLEQYGDEEHITCRNLESGKVLWSHAVPARHDEFMGGVGPRSTPAIYESKVYTVCATGVVTCLELSNGQLVWRDDLRARYFANLADPKARDAADLKLVMWGRATSPLIYGDLCIVPAGGTPAKSLIDGQPKIVPAGAIPAKSLIAYDRLTGHNRWEGGDTQISYASPTVLTITGKEQVVSVNENNITGHDPATGAQQWAYEWPGHSSMNASASQPHLLDDNRLFISKGYDEGAAVFQVAELGGEYHTETLWKQKRLLQTKFSNAVIVDGFAYGLSDGVMQCVDLAQGKQMWKAGRYGHGQILAAGDVILVQTEKTGEVVMLAIDSQKHRELGRVKSLSTQSQAWNNLCLASNKLLVRNADEAVCLELP